MHCSQQVAPRLSQKTVDDRITSGAKALAGPSINLRGEVREQAAHHSTSAHDGCASIP